MEYKIRCNKCGDVFKARTERQGLQKVRCPYCGSVLNCQLGGDKPFRTKARSVIPFSEAREVDTKTEETQPTAKVKFLKMATAEMLQAAKTKLNNQSQQVSVLAASTTAATTEYISKSSSRLKAFQEKYKNGDLLIFFIGSFTFILLVFIGLYLLSVLTNIIYDSHLWLFKKYIELKNSIGF
ncbi:hypothetical protein [Prevotella aurantiaca]|uniref:hypothetical protein n=1 Tax=Prevotella aurantiaca TaxID=596085 RepID=UPI0028DB885B|nr:hypothetical protein [Prevotella aurantiaca]